MRNDLPVTGLVLMCIPSGSFILTIGVKAMACSPPGQCSPPPPPPPPSPARASSPSSPPRPRPAGRSACSALMHPLQTIHYQHRKMKNFQRARVQQKQTLKPNLNQPQFHYQVQARPQRRPSRILREPQQTRPTQLTQIGWWGTV